VRTAWFSNNATRLRSDIGTALRERRGYDSSVRPARRTGVFACIPGPQFHPLPPPARILPVCAFLPMPYDAPSLRPSGYLAGCLTGLPHSATLHTAGGRRGSRLPSLTMVARHLDGIGRCGMRGHRVQRRWRFETWLHHTTAAPHTRLSYLTPSTRHCALLPAASMRRTRSIQTGLAPQHNGSWQQQPSCTERHSPTFHLQLPSYLAWLCAAPRYAPPTLRARPSQRMHAHTHTLRAGRRAGRQWALGGPWGRAAGRARKKRRVDAYAAIPPHPHHTPPAQPACHSNCRHFPPHSHTLPTPHTRFAPFPSTHVQSHH